MKLCLEGVVMRHIVCRRRYCRHGRVTLLRSTFSAVDAVMPTRCVWNWQYVLHIVCIRPIVIR